MTKAKFITFLISLGSFLFCLEDSGSQGQPPPPMPPADPQPPIPAGVDVQARGPVHEGFAAPTSEAVPSPVVNMKPPPPIEEMPPEERPEGNMVWIGGYYHYDEERRDFLWVSGCWRVKPQGREWVPGYWREEGSGWQWVGGFWAQASAEGKVSEMTYLPKPPEPPAVAPPGEPPTPNSFYVPGNYVWVQTRYVWQAGFWTAGHSDYVWIPGHYRWTIRGYVFIPGHWDLVLARRGLLYAPVVVAAGPGFVYTPAYAVNADFIVGAMFIRPAHCHFYFGSYYGPVYVGWGYESCLLYSRRYYDPYVVYFGWRNPGWFRVQFGIYGDRLAGRVALPPRRLVEIDIRLRAGFVGPGRAVIGFHGGRAVALSVRERTQIRDHAREVRNAAHNERMRNERPGAGHGTVAVHVPAHNVHGSVGTPAKPNGGHPPHPAPKAKDKKR